MLTGFQKAREITNYFASAYLLTVSSLCLFARCLPAKPFTDTVIQFDIYEERPHGTMIGDVFQRIQSVTHSSSNFSNFVIVANQPAVSTLFQIDQDRGHLLTKRKLDRDSICQQDALCCPSAVSDENRHSGSNSLRNGAQQITLYRTLDECQIVFRVLYNVVTGSSDKNQTVSVNDAEYFGERGYVTIVLNVIDLNDNAPKFLLPVATNIPNTGQPGNNRLRTLATSPLPTVELWIDETTEPDVCFELPVAFDEDSTPYSVTEYHLSKVSQSEVFQRFDSSERHVETFDSELPFVLMQSSCSGVEWDENRLGFTSDPFSTTLDGVSSGGKLPNSRIVPHVKLVSKLDREVRDEYWMKVLAMDSSETGLSVSDKLKDSKQEQGVWNTIHSLRHTGTLLVRVRILDANDNPPEIASNLEIQINEDVAIGTVIDTLSGTDRDAGDNGRLTYRIDPESLGMQQQNFPFKIHPISGAITVSQALDADQSRSESVSRQIRFNVITSDAGKPVPKSALTVVTVSIANVNDETPQIKVVDLQSQTNPPRPLVKENLPPGQLVAFVTATDRDSGIYGSVRCQVDNQKFQLEIINPIVPMVISDTAASKALESHANKHNNMLEFKLTTTVSLDHELAAYEVVEIICTDQAIEASAIRTGRSRILVTVIDENDNSPKFDRDELYLRINENEAINELITTFNATDADQVQRLPSRQWADYHLLNRERFSAPDFRAEDYRSVQKIRYSIDSVGNGYFHLDSLTGALYSKVRFDREEQDVVNFTVTATDGGIPPRNASIHVVVSVVDKNDNPPKFDQDLYEFELFENTSVGATIFELKATDRDVGFNAEIVYQMEDFQVSKIQFSVRSLGGSLLITTTLQLGEKSVTTFRYTVTQVTYGEFFNESSMIRCLVHNVINKVSRWKELTAKAWQMLM
ncbi:Protocadherin-7 [Clonorchis sinensis]|uniref:Protocadherin-11 X-linked n=2 Tax=Clonorchis sinensis TaxID=79923 RepID=H2KTD8_CLOSI|nr:Protocadherin-7 [Clonorchis sinensis]GAA40948.2 protocadherin-11 X-linked [Clonorchis sinensis]